MFFYYSNQDLKNKILVKSSNACPVTIKKKIIRKFCLLSILNLIIGTLIYLHYMCCYFYFLCLIFMNFRVVSEMKPHARFYKKNY